MFDSTTKPSSRDRNNLSTGVRIRNIRESGDTIICDIIVKPESVGVTDRPAHGAQRRTLEATPNPFSREVSLSPLPSGTSVRIFSTNGALVWNADAPAAGRLTWDGRTESGAALPEGVYLIQASGATAAPAKVVLNH